MSIPSNYETFRECVSAELISKCATGNEKKKKRARNRKESVGTNKKSHGETDVENQVGDSESGRRSDAEELAEFIDVYFLNPLLMSSLIFRQYLSAEIFTSLPDDLRTLSYSAMYNDSELVSRYSDPISQDVLSELIDTLPPSITDSLVAYGLASSASATSSFLSPIFTAYVTSTTAPPPPWQSTRASSCELCARSWIPLTYHHLIPRGVHAKALKRGWVEEWELNKVAWLCRACHNFVHSVATNEELAREWSSVERLLEREDVRSFTEWVGRVRWKAR